MSITRPLSKLKTPPPTRGVFRRHISLRIKLPLIVIFLLSLALLISTILSIRTTQAALIDTLKNELTAYANSKAELIRSNLIWTKGVATDLAASAETVNYDEESIKKTISNTLAHNEQIFGSTIAYEPYQFQPELYYWAPYYSRTTNGDLQFTQLGNREYDYFQLGMVYPAQSKARASFISPLF